MPPVSFALPVPLAGIYKGRQLGLKEIAPEQNTWVKCSAFGFTATRGLNAGNERGRSPGISSRSNRKTWSGVYLAYRVRRAESVEEILLRAAELHPEEPMIRFNWRAMRA
jgi:hypothetical protein